MKLFQLSAMFSFIAFVLAGCQSPGVLQLSADTYVVSKSSAAGAFTNMAKLRASAIQEANAFAEKQGKIAVPLASHEVVPAHGFPSYEYQFQVLDKNDPRARGASLVPRADVVIEKTEKVTGDIRTQDTTEKKTDLYTELTKLDDLRKKGIITDEEFAAQKKRLLEKQ